MSGRTFRAIIGTLIIAASIGLALWAHGLRTDNWSWHEVVLHAALLFGGYHLIDNDLAKDFLSGIVRILSAWRGRGDPQA